MPVTVFDARPTVFLSLPVSWGNRYYAHCFTDGEVQRNGLSVPNGFVM